MLSGPSSRRDFLRTSGALALGGGLALSLSGCREAADSASEAMRAGDAPRVLTADEIRTLEAFADRILPPEGEAPGAAALGAVVFMDHYAARRPEVLADIRRSVATLDGRVKEAHAGVGGLGELDPADADAAVSALEEEAPEAFWPLQTFVVFGAFAAPAHGGNRDKAAWALVGYEDRMAWQPPFGFYDAQAADAAQGGDR